MFVNNPDPFLLPSFRISPFKTDYVSFNFNLPEGDYASAYFNNRFGEGNWRYTLNGREGIKMSLESYNLDKNDLVTIVTTSGNFYISSCVTQEIETACRWNREICPETKIIFVNHEFGYPYPEMEKLIQTGLPIIEDCCTTFFSQDSSERIGSYGDFAIYSFPKFFPLQLGGLLVSNKQKIVSNKSMLNLTQIAYLENGMSYYLSNKEKLLEKRAENLNYAISLFTQLGFKERFGKCKNIVPSLLLLNNNNVIKDLNLLKVYLFNHGIQCSVFYGEDGFFIPSHQNLQKEDIDYIFECIQEFIKLKL